MTEEVQTKVELKDSFLKTFRFNGRQDISDTKLMGFQLRVSKSEELSFSVRARGPDGKMRRVAIGKYPSTSLKEAREAARIMIGRIKAGENVNADKRAARVEKPSFPTLRQILDEYEQSPRGLMTGTWQKSKTGCMAQAPRTILSVLGEFADRDVTGITENEISAALQGHERIGRTGTAKTALGQAAHARAYLKTPLDWASGRGRYRKVGRGRIPTLPTPDMELIADPSENDPTITGVRARALNTEEIQAVMPWLTYPARPELGMRLAPEKDFRPIFLRFILLTAPRKGEVETMRWRDVNIERGIWTKPDVKDTHRRNGAPRIHIVHLSDAALSLLQGLPGADLKTPDALVFPNDFGGVLGNWSRIMKPIYRQSKTSGWHRHDLRRTSSTILFLRGIDPGLISRVLGHVATKDDSPDATAMYHYFAKHMIIKGVVNPMKVAMDVLALTLDQICSGETEMPDSAGLDFGDELD